MTDAPRNSIQKTYHSAQFAPEHDLSDRGYALYDRIYRAAIGRYLPPDRSARILDLGCGTGMFLHFLQAEGYTNIVGIDVSTEQLSICRKKTDAQVEQADARDYLARHIDEFKLIAAHHLLEHYSPEGAVELCASALDALAADGTLIATTPNMSNLLAGRMRHADLTHETGFTEESLRHCLAAAGFDEIEIADGGVPISFFGRMRAFVERLTHRFFYRLCCQPPPNVCSCSLLAVAKKPPQADKNRRLLDR